MTTINMEGFFDAIAGLLDEYQEQVTISTEKGLDNAANVFIKYAKTKSPRRTGNYAKNWKMKPKDAKYKLRRYVGNTTTVKGKKSDAIPLINILEYSTKANRRPHVQKILDASVPEMVKAIENSLKG